MGNFLYTNFVSINKKTLVWLYTINETRMKLVPIVFAKHCTSF